MRTRVLALLIGAVVSFGLAAPAFAASSVYYGSAAQPIKAENNSSDGNAWFYGAAAVVDQTWLRNRYWYRDSAPGGNKAYVTTAWFFYRKCLDGQMCYDRDSEDRSTDDSSGNWRVEMDYVDLEFAAERGRAQTRTCENQNNRPDPCSNYVTATLTY